MARIVRTAAAQLGPIGREESRQSTIARMIDLMREAHAAGAQLVVYPELALTTFFPRWYFENQPDVDAFFEREMPGPETRALFEESARLGVGFYLGYAEQVTENNETHYYNTSILVDQTGSIIGKYRKIHLPGHQEHEPWRPFQHLEKRYFERGNLGFPVFDAFNGKLGMCLCNDRRWPETYRVLGLQQVEMIMIGYNTPKHYPLAPEHDHLQEFHNHLVMQSGAYQNGSWIIGVAKAGLEEDCELIGESCIINPLGEIVAQCKTLDDEVIVADCDLDICSEIQNNIFNFALHREPEEYALICAPKTAS